MTQAALQAPRAPRAPATLPRVDSYAPAKPVNKWMVAIAVALGALLEVIDTSIVNVALSEMQNSLGATLAQVSWVVSSYAVANVIILPLTAWLGDRFGKKRYFIFSLITFTLASILCGCATTLPMLIVARVLQGLGGGGLMAKAQSILFETFPKSEQAMAQGFFGAIVIAGPALGPTLGGYIVTNIDWRWIFFINIPVGIGAVFMCSAYLAEDRKKTITTGIDWASIALLAIGLGSLQTVLEEGQSDEWFDSQLIVTLSAIAAVGVVLFVIRQVRSSAPVVDLRVLKNRSLWAGSILSVTIGMALYGALFSIPIYATVFLHFTSQQTGMLLLPGAIASAIAMPIVARLLQKFDPRILLTCGGLILCVAMFQLQHMSVNTGADDLFWPLIVRAFGTVMMFLPLNMSALGPLPKKDIAAGAGFFSLTRQLGGSVGVAILTTILSRREAFHRLSIVEHVDTNAPATLSRMAQMTAGFVAKGADPATAKMRALALINGTVDAQSAILSFNDMFYLTSVLILVTLPLVFLLGKPAANMPAPEAH